MKQTLKKHWQDWKQAIAIIATVVGVGWIGHAVDLWRLPDAVKLADKKNDERYEETKSLMAGVVSNQVVMRQEQIVMKDEQHKDYAYNNVFHLKFWQTMTNFVNESRKDRIELRHLITNSPPVIPWPEYTLNFTNPMR